MNGAYQLPAVIMIKQNSFVGLVMTVTIYKASLLKTQIPWQVIFQDMIELFGIFQAFCECYHGPV